MAWLASIPAELGAAKAAILPSAASAATGGSALTAAGKIASAPVGGFFSNLPGMAKSVGIPGAGIVDAGLSGDKGFFANTGDYLKTNNGRNEIASAVSQQGKQSSDAAAAGSQGAIAQGMKFAGAGGAAPIQSAPSGTTLSSSGYDPMSIFERLAKFRG